VNIKKRRIKMSKPLEKKVIEFGSIWNQPVEVYRFEHKSSALDWLLNQDYPEVHNRVDVEWDYDSCGWYIVSLYKEPCARGCCKQSAAKLIPIESWLDIVGGFAYDYECKAKNLREQQEKLRLELGIKEYE
jgi:hypothetical protein